MILVTGAGGKTGRAVIQALAVRGAAVRGLVRRPEQVDGLRSLGATEAVAGDMHDPAALRRALDGCDAVYHICPNVSADELAMAQVAVSAARVMHTRLFVYHSVLHPQVEAMPHHWQKMRVEEMLFETGLPFVILQPGMYMQNVLAQWSQIIAGIYPIPYGAETRLGMVDLRDVGEAAARVLTESGHAGATYELAGPEVLTQSQVAETLGAELGRPVTLEITPPSAWAQRARASGMSEYQVDTLLKMFAYYEGYSFWGNSRVLGWLLGREPGSFASFVARTVRAVAQEAER